jgi:HEPN domain-containing protein
VPKRYPPVDPREWLNRARSDLLMAKSRKEGIYLEDLCFHAQQAAEKAVKAVLIKHSVKFPYVHDVAELLTLIENAGLKIPKLVKQAGKLTRFAVFTRYPGIAEAISEEEYAEALTIAAEVIRWVESRLKARR